MTSFLLATSGSDTGLSLFLKKMAEQGLSPSTWGVWPGGHLFADRLWSRSAQDWEPDSGFPT